MAVRLTTIAFCFVEIRAFDFFKRWTPPLTSQHFKHSVMYGRRKFHILKAFLFSPVTSQKDVGEALLLIASS